MPDYFPPKNSLRMGDGLFVILCPIIRLNISSFRLSKVISPIYLLPIDKARARIFRIFPEQWMGISSAEKKSLRHLLLDIDKDNVPGPRERNAAGKYVLSVMKCLENKKEHKQINGRKFQSEVEIESLRQSNASSTSPTIAINRSNVLLDTMKRKSLEKLYSIWIGLPFQLSLRRTSFNLEFHGYLIGNKL